MVKAEWGTKRMCPSCGNRFYDLGKNPAICPKCSYKYDPSVFIRRRGRAIKKTVVEKEDKEENVLSFATKKGDLKKKKTKPKEDEGEDTVLEVEEEELQEIGEIEEIEEEDEDGADDKNILEELDVDDGSLVDILDEDAIFEAEGEDEPAGKGKKAPAKGAKQVKLPTPAKGKPAAKDKAVKTTAAKPGKKQKEKAAKAKPVKKKPVAKPLKKKQPPKKSKPQKKAKPAAKKKKKR